MKKLMIGIIFIIIPLTLLAQEINHQTFTYYQDDSTLLELDLFLPDINDSAEKVPLLIFVHGGGFSNGTRDRGYNICETAAQNGIASATITYTLYMKGKSFGCDGILSEKIRAIQIAANQTWLATSFFLENHEIFNIDTAEIFIGGSSAGAETVLHAAFWDQDEMGLYPQKLSASFKYAGVISGAGAIADINLINEETKIPILFSHGTDDKLVPYAIAPHHYCKTTDSDYLMLFGAFSIFQKLLELNESAYLMSYNGGGHEHSGTLFKSETETVIWFINHTLAGEHFQIHRAFNK